MKQSLSAHNSDWESSQLKSRWRRLHQIRIILINNESSDKDDVDVSQNKNTEKEVIVTENVREIKSSDSIYVIKSVEADNLAMQKHADND